MKKWNILLLTLIFSVITNSLFAHALWIETAGAGKIGKEQTVKIYYGEYEDGERDSVIKWYSDLKDLSLWLVTPDQQKIQLTTAPGTNYYEARFTPATNGTYTLAVSHQTRELGENTRYHFLASTDVTVGKPTVNSAVAVNSFQLHKSDVNPTKLNKEIQLKALLDNVNASGKKVSVFSPNGWSKELITDANGVIAFVPPFKGRYVIEISDMDKVAGEHYGKPYQETWKAATYSIEVK